MTVGNTGQAYPNRRTYIHYTATSTSMLSFHKQVWQKDPAGLMHLYPCTLSNCSTVKHWSGYSWFICAFAFLLSTFHSHRTVDRCRYWPSSSETVVYGLDHWLYLCNWILFKWLILSLVWPTQSEVITLKLVYCFGFSRTVCI